MPDLCILDVGHGSCAVLDDRSGSGVHVIDAGPGSSLLEFLKQRRITDIASVFITHADADHIAGLVALLAQKDISVNKVFLNPDASQMSKKWTDLRQVVDNQPPQRLSTELTTETVLDISKNGMQVEILAPKPALAMSGSGGTDLQGRVLTSNSMSVVIRIIVDAKPEVLIMGDIDKTGFENLRDDCPQLHARVLVFPHHGGASGSSNEFDFARELCSRVDPETVVFSIGRNRSNFPKPQIVQGVRAANSQLHVACTQLSKSCAADIPSASPSHLTDEYARGRRNNQCCAGTISIGLGETEKEHERSVLNQHRNFVVLHVPDALCQQNLKSVEILE